MKDIGQSTKHLYRLWIVCTLLRETRIEGHGKAHDYPLFILTQILVMEHWRTTEYVAVAMMREDLSIVNEEFGEITFSMLGRLVMGDNCKSDFEHMHRIYSMIPIYRDVKDDLLDDTGRVGSLSWRHTIGPQSQAVVLTGTFFQKLIREVVANTYLSYDGSRACFKSQAAAATHLSSLHTPLMWNPQVLNSFDASVELVRSRLSSNFLGPHVDLWPEANIAAEDRNVNRQNLSVNDLDESKEAEFEGQRWGAPWRHCQAGRLAVCTCEFVDGLGLAVYAIEEIKQDTEDEEGQLVRTFTARQYRCSVKNTDQGCLTGTWKSESRTQIETVNDWEVLTYFRQMAHNGRLPEDVVEKIREHERNTAVFQN
jgi:hypothetical protein